MTNKELRKMSRSELLEILIAQMEENERLNAKLSAASDELENRTIAVHNAGSLAEAALQLNGIFEAAEAAAEQYLDNVRSASLTAAPSALSIADSAAKLHKQTQIECNRLIEQCREECQKERQTCEEECRKKLALCQTQCEQMKAQAQAEGEKMLTHFKEESRKIYERAAQIYNAARQDKANS